MRTSAVELYWPVKMFILIWSNIHASRLISRPRHSVVKPCETTYLFYIPKNRAKYLITSYFKTTNSYDTRSDEMKWNDGSQVFNGNAGKYVFYILFCCDIGIHKHIQVGNAVTRFVIRYWELGYFFFFFVTICYVRYNGRTISVDRIKPLCQLYKKYKNQKRVYTHM